MFADAAAVGIPAAQAIGRLGNWFNNELYGSHTNLPWGLTVYNYDLSTGEAFRDNGEPVVTPGGPFHPTFLYELIWDLGVAALVYFVDRKLKLGKGRAFALYVMAYIGRFDRGVASTRRTSGVRANNWVSILVFRAR
jgi:prolipoprotein diacylglyceryltransferase